jgi:superfamily I DNA/RNA helicase
MNAEKIHQANNLEDRYDCLLVISGNCNSVGEIHAEIKRIFSNQDEGITLSTVHKAKGLEADNVYVLATERMPHPKATNMEEERNICYVAITRAKQNLFYCGPKPTGGRYGR